MKILKTAKMKSLLRRGINKAKRLKSKPRDGMMYNLIYETLLNGWHYQVEYVFDHRVQSSPYVIVYGFKPGDASARMADYYLRQML